MSYVLIDGVDGSGKTTLAKLLVQCLERSGKPVRHLAFPSRESAVGRLIRDSFEGKCTINPDAMLWLFVAEAQDLEPQIRSHLGNGGWIVCDRHVMVSARVYQNEVHGIETVDDVINAAHLTVPNRMYIMDLPAGESLRRRQLRNEARNVLYEPEQLEHVESLCAAYRRVHKRFEAYSDLLDATKSIEENLRWIWKDLGLAGDPLQG